MDEYLKFKRLKIQKKTTKNCHLSTSNKNINYNPSLLKQMYIISTYLPQKKQALVTRRNMTKQYS